MWSPLLPDWYTGDEERDELRLRIWAAISHLSPKRADLIITWLELAARLPEDHKAPTFEELAEALGLKAKSSAHDTWVAAIEDLEELLSHDAIVCEHLRLGRG